MSRSGATTVFKQLTDLERELQRLKIQAYFNLPQKPSTLYPEETIRRVLKSTREAIWQKRYAKKVKGIS